MAKQTLGLYTALKNVSSPPQPSNKAYPGFIPANRKLNQKYAGDMQTMSAPNPMRPVSQKDHLA